MFERVQKMGGQGWPQGQSPRLLARLGVLRCGSCDGRLSASSTGLGYAFYRCANTDCPRRVSVGAEPIERKVIEAVKDAARSKRGQARGEQRAAEAEEAAKRAQEALTKAIRVLEDFGDEQATHDRLAVLRADRDGKRERADRLADAYPAEENVDVERVFAEGTLEEQRSVIRNRVAYVTVAPDGAQAA